MNLKDCLVAHSINPKGLIKSSVSQVVIHNALCTPRLCCLNVYVGFFPSVTQPSHYCEQENAANVALDFGFSSLKFANPVFTSWNVSGSELAHMEPPILVNSSVLMFDKVTREHSGVYTLTNMYCLSNECDAISRTLTLMVQCKLMYK